MTLPLSRNTTYGVGSLVRSVDLNDLQDCVVTGKHGTRILAVPGYAFRSVDSMAAQVAGNTPTVSDGEWDFAPAASGSNPYIEAPLWLPAGKRVVSIEYWFNKGGSTQPFYAQLVSRTIGAGARAISLVSQFSDTTAGSGYISRSLAALNRTIAAGELMSLVVGTGGPSRPHKFSHAFVTYDQTV